MQTVFDQFQTAVCNSSIDFIHHIPQVSEPLIHRRPVPYIFYSLHSSPPAYGSVFTLRIPYYNAFPWRLAAFSEVHYFLVGAWLSCYKYVYDVMGRASRSLNIDFPLPYSFAHLYPSYFASRSISNALPCFPRSAEVGQLP